MRFRKIRKPMASLHLAPIQAQSARTSPRALHYDGQAIASMLRAAREKLQRLELEVGPVV
jgi:hypothetical protein